MPSTGLPYPPSVNKPHDHQSSPSMLVTLSWRCNLGLVVSVLRVKLVVGLLRRGTGLPRGVLAATFQCATESRMTQWQSANPVRAVVSLSSVMVFRIVKRVTLQTNCDSCVRLHVGILTVQEQDEKKMQGPIQACFHHQMMPLQVSYHIPLFAVADHP